jgi:hypothetical protein
MADDEIKQFWVGKTPSPVPLGVLQSEARRNFPFSERGFPFS